MLLKTLRFTLLCALFIIPPAILIGGIKVTERAVITFLILAFLIPLLLRRFSGFSAYSDVLWNPFLFGYCWLLGVITMWGSAGALANFPVQSFWGEAVLSLALLFIWLLGVFLLTSLATSLWRKKLDTYLFQLLDISFSSLPLPWGMAIALFLALPPQEFNLLGQSFVAGMIIILKMLLGIVTLTFYFYPFGKEHKLLYVPGIFGRVFLWIGVFELLHFIVVQYPAFTSQVQSTFMSTFAISQSSVAGFFLLGAILFDLVALALALVGGKLIDDALFRLFAKARA